ncbi:myo-inositol-1(or 4)-monophosphatase [Rhizobium sp. NFR07]|uniref:3'(2'),5'-bisphosphate nucleotidase CysQ n=1 Tax=Rhizobium sp. NFR07 TaxID=1566262 RepID=UPI0008E24D61|nr:3'(2'),5'-bisphosphate nucleotidase CysQ [Rhizobium sp. NFR07]SFB08042.1 myo-inositol-1(or 4)-monophosphatase [Rhizobium sp. NFR07]
MVEARTSWDDDLALILDAARGAGEIANRFFGHSPEVWWKNEGRSPVSAADFAANDHLQSVLLKARPDYGWLSEETDDDDMRLSRETVFVIDPIDGTRAFIAGKATWCVSVAVVHQGRPVAGVLVAPALNEEFSAALDRPASKNGMPIAVGSAGDDGELVLAADEKIVSRLTTDLGIRRVPHVPSLAYRLAMAADGRIDGTIVKSDSHDWDLAAADLILERAGGALTDLQGRPLSYNRKTVSHGVLVAGTNEARMMLMPYLLTGAAG